MRSPKVAKHFKKLSKAKEFSKYSYKAQKAKDKKRAVAEQLDFENVNESFIDALDNGVIPDVISPKLTKFVNDGFHHENVKANSETVVEEEKVAELVVAGM